MSIFFENNVTTFRAKTAVSKMEQAIQVVDKSILDSKIAQCQLAAHLEQRSKYTS